MSRTPPVALGMVDRSRILLCVLTFLGLSFNPLTSLLQWGGAHDTDQHPSSGSSRSVLSLESGPTGWLDWVMPTLLLWLVNGVIVLSVFVKLLVHGEPVIRPHSRSSVTFWRHRRQADLDLSRGFRSCRRQPTDLPVGSGPGAAHLPPGPGLQPVLERDPLQPAEAAPGALAAQEGLPAPASPPATAAGFEDEAKTSARDAALAYHRLHQLHITGKLPAGSACSDVHMALCAVNLAECAEEKIRQARWSRSI